MNVDGASERVTQLIDEEFARKVTEINEEETSVRTRELIDKINQKCEAEPLDDQVQKTLAEAIGLLTDVALTDILWVKTPQVIDAIDLSVDALFANPPKTELAQGIHDHLKTRLYPSTRQTLWRSFKRSMMSSPAAVVVLGLGVLFCLLIIAFWRVGSGFRVAEITSALGAEPAVLVLIAFVGALGSIVSIMTRVRSFAFSGSRDAWPFFFFGLFKPVVGAVFALFVFSALQAALIPGFEIPTEPNGIWFIVAVAFLAGFSERFAGDVVDHLDDGLDQAEPSWGTTTRRA